MMLAPFALGPIHFIGIGGIGMSGLAQILHGMGCTVQGSDLSRNANVVRLEALGISIMTPQQAENLGDAATVVVSTAIQPTNPELLAAKRLGLPIIHRADVLAQIMARQWSIAIAGSHGKTSTTSLMAHVMDTAGYDPTVINGGIITTYGSNARLGKGAWVVAEADESDGSFTKLLPTIAIVTNMDEEHMDHYPNFAAIESAFAQFINAMPFYGVGLMGIDNPAVRDLAAKCAHKTLITYGLHEDAQVRGHSLRSTSNGMIFDVTLPDGAFKDVHLSMMGQHNVQNALSVIGISMKLGIPEDVLRQALSTFQGVKRRLTLVGHINQAPVYDDYAHHPTEILAIVTTLRAAIKAKPQTQDQNQPQGKLIAVMQPHRYSRLHHLMTDFAAALVQCDDVYLLPVYSAGEAPIPGVDSPTLAGHMATIGADDARARVHLPTDDAGLFAGLRSIVQPEDIVVFMGAGDITAKAAMSVQ